MKVCLGSRTFRANTCRCCSAPGQGRPHAGLQPCRGQHRAKRFAQPQKVKLSQPAQLRQRRQLSMGLPRWSAGLHVDGRCALPLAVLPPVADAGAGLEQKPAAHRMIVVVRSRPIRHGTMHVQLARHHVMHSQSIVGVHFFQFTSSSRQGPPFSRVLSQCGNPAVLVAGHTLPAIAVVRGVAKLPALACVPSPLESPVARPSAAPLHDRGSPSLRAAVSSDLQAHASWHDSQQIQCQTLDHLAQHPHLCPSPPAFARYQSAAALPHERAAAAGTVQRQYFQAPFSMADRLFRLRWIPLLQVPLPINHKSLPTGCSHTLCSSRLRRTHSVAIRFQQLGR